MSEAGEQLRSVQPHSEAAVCILASESAEGIIGEQCGQSVACCSGMVGDVVRIVLLECPQPFDVKHVEDLLRWFNRRGYELKLAGRVARMWPPRGRLSRLAYGEARAEVGFAIPAEDVEAALGRGIARALQDKEHGG